MSKHIQVKIQQSTQNFNITINQTKIPTPKILFNPKHTLNAHFIFKNNNNDNSKGLTLVSDGHSSPREECYSAGGSPPSMGACGLGGLGAMGAMGAVGGMGAMGGMPGMGAQLVRAVRSPPAHWRVHHETSAKKTNALGKLFKCVSKNMFYSF